nr:hypothetical protein [Streptomyces sp. ISL-99]
MDEEPLGIGRGDGAFVAKNHQGEEPFREVLGDLCAAGEGFSGSEVQDGEVGFFAGPEVADDVVEVECLSAAECGQVEAAPCQRPISSRVCCSASATLRSRR